MSTPTLDQACDTRIILRLILRVRQRLRRERRDQLFYIRLGRATPLKANEAIDAMLPPRSEWPRPGKDPRRRASVDGRDAQSELLARYVLRLWTTPNRAAPDWLKRLRRFVSRIRARVLEWINTDALTQPDIVAIQKPSKSPGAVQKYRCVAMYSLEDQLVVSTVALYLRRVLDPVFSPGVLAFRAPADGAPATHHDAVERIERFRAAPRPRGQGNLWVAEVDIRGFYDALDHSLVRDVTRELEAELERPLDSRAWGVLNAYLHSYDFNHYGHPKALEHAQQRAGDTNVEVPWCRAQLQKLGTDVELGHVGVPQGGAISCFLANAMLHKADVAVENALSGTDAIYLRFCDDIIIITRTKTACDSALRAYSDALRRLRLPAHQAVDIAYGEDFWLGKSKKPYRWAADGVPWCSFVGYQLRYDGLLRIRPSSIRKEKQKQRDVVTNSIKAIRRFRRRENGRGVTPKQAQYRVRQKLRSLSVGTTLLHLGEDRSAFCWAAGFTKLAEEYSLVSQLRELDRYRDRQLRRFHATLKRMGEPRRRRNRGVEHDDDDRLLAFEGRPYSYASIVTCTTPRGQLRLPFGKGVELPTRVEHRLQGLAKSGRREQDE